MHGQERRTMLRRRLRRLLWLLLLAALFLGGRWGWDALHPPSVARWKASLRAAVYEGDRAMTDRCNGKIDAASRHFRKAERAFLAAIREARRFGRGDARLAETYLEMGEMYTFSGYVPASPTDMVPPAYYDQETPSITGVLMTPANWLHLRARVKESLSPRLAEYCYRQALATYAHGPNQRNPRQLEVLYALAWCYSMQGKTTQCAQTYQRLVEAAERIYGKHDPRIIPSLEYAIAYYRDYCSPPKYAEAEADLQRIIALLETRHGPNNTLIETYLDQLLTLAVQSRDIATANQCVRKYLALYARQYQPGTESYAVRLQGTGDEIDGFGLPIDATPLFLKALETYETLHSTDAGYCVQHLCDIYRLAGHPDKEEALLKRHIAWLQRTFPKGTMLRQALENLVEFYYRRKDPQQERTARARLRALFPGDTFIPGPLR